MAALRFSIVLALAGTSTLAYAQPEPEQPVPAEEAPAEEAPAEEAPPDEDDSPAAEPADPPSASSTPVAAADTSSEAPAEAGSATDESKAGKPAEKAKPHEGSFSFGSYGRVIAATDGTGRPGRNADIVGQGSRLDHSNYVELELRRDDHWAKVGADTRFVATLALGHPVFHYDGDFDAQFAVRNLYMEEKDLGLKGLSMWAGSRMQRGDDIYLLDYWPLDNLNTLGGGLRYEAPTRTSIALHMGMGQPDKPFYKQLADRPAPLNQFGVASIDLLDRQRWIGSARVQQSFHFGKTDPAPGIKLVAYAEAHQLPSGQRETEQAEVYQDVPAESGFVIGGQIGGWTGKRDTHLNLFVRYARGLAAYGEFAAPEGLATDRTSSGAHEVVIAAGGNWEIGPMAVMVGGYFRSFRNASEALDFGDLDEGIIVARPQVWFADWVGLGVEGSYQAQQRGVLIASGPDDDPSAPLGNDPEPLNASVGRVGVMPFVTPAGRGSFSRPSFWFIYTAAFRNEGARALYPDDDPYRRREVEHFFGFGAEWWFGSTSYGGQ